MSVATVARRRGAIRTYLCSDDQSMQSRAAASASARSELAARIDSERAEAALRSGAEAAQGIRTETALQSARRSLRCSRVSKKQRSHYYARVEVGDRATRPRHRRQDSASRGAGRSHAAGCAGAHRRGEDARRFQRDRAREPRTAAQLETILRRQSRACTHVEVAEDPQLSDQDCLLETELGTANFGLDTQLKEVEQGFFDLLALRPAN